MLQGSFFYEFISVWRISFSQTLQECLLVTNSFSFPSYENIFIPLSFLWDSFTRYWICNRQFFSFRAWKILCYLLLGSMVSNKKSAIIQSVVPYRECVISPTAFKNFSIYLFSEVLLWCVFLHFGGGLVSCLKFTHLSESVGLYLLPNLGSLIHYFFQYVIALLTFSPSETSRKQMLDILL